LAGSVGELNVRKPVFLSLAFSLLASGLALSDEPKATTSQSATTVDIVEGQPVSASQFKFLYNAARDRVSRYSMAFRIETYRCKDGRRIEQGAQVATVSEDNIGTHRRTVTEFKGYSNESEFTMSHVLTPKWEKFLESRPGNPPRGFVDGTNPRSQLSMQATVSMAQNLFDPWRYAETLNWHDAVVTYDVQTRFYKAAIPRGQGRALVIVVDPRKGFMPVAQASLSPSDSLRGGPQGGPESVPVGEGLPPDKDSPVEELLKAAGTGAVFKMVYSDYREMTPGVWLPFHIGKRTPNISADFTVLKAKIDPKIAETDFDIQFPEGAVVEDSISNRKYLAGAGGEATESRPLKSKTAK
jgi:hypothetical protein